MDIVGPSRIVSLGGNVYTLIVIDDCSCYTYILFLSLKRETFDSFRKLAKIIQNEKGLSIALIRIDHDGEFQKKKKIVTRMLFGIPIQLHELSNKI